MPIEHFGQHLTVAAGWVAGRGARALAVGEGNEVGGLGLAIDELGNSVLIAIGMEVVEGGHTCGAFVFE